MPITAARRPRPAADSRPIKKQSARDRQKPVISTNAIYVDRLMFPTRSLSSDTARNAMEIMSIVRTIYLHMNIYNEDRKNDTK